MSVNKYLPHVFILPEDDANRQVANGFLLFPIVVARQIYVLPVAGGWNQVLDRFRADHVSGMEIYPHRFMILLFDFDGDEGRFDKARQAIPEALADRVFALGALTTPEALRQAGLGNYEEIGFALAKDCYDGAAAVWGHDLLRHNSAELNRLTKCLRQVLFMSA